MTDKTTEPNMTRTSAHASKRIGYAAEGSTGWAIGKRELAQEWMRHDEAGAAAGADAGAAAGADAGAAAGAGARAREEGVKESLPPRGDPGGMAVNRLRFHAKHRLLLLGDVFHALCFGEGATVGIEPALYRCKKLRVRKAEQLIPRHVRDYRKV